MKTAKELREYMLGLKERSEISGRLGILGYQIYEKSQLQFVLDYNGRAELNLFEREEADGFTVGTYDEVTGSIRMRSAIWKWDEAPHVLPQKYPDGVHIRELAQALENFSTEGET